MAFMESLSPKVIGSEGSPEAKIAIIGEAPGRDEMIAGRPFVGSAGQVLESCLHSAGLTRADVYITNLVKTQPYKNNIAPWYNDKSGLTEKGRECAEALKSELEHTKANVFVTLGNSATFALTGRNAITDIRGYIFPSTLLNGKKVIPSIHPASTLYAPSNYIQRYYIVHDLQRARAECDSPLIKYTERKLIVDMTFPEALEWLDYFKAQKSVSFDLEVINYQVSCIGLSSDPGLGVSVPMYQKWDASQEAFIWKRFADLLEDPEIEKVGQNLIFDIWFLALQCNIFVRGPIRDTMIAHSIMYPEMLKGLGFLASIYTTDEYWKDMVDFKNPKKEN